jgi:hypothetical protein
MDGCYSALLCLEHVIVRDRFPPVTCDPFFLPRFTNTNQLDIGCAPARLCLDHTIPDRPANDTGYTFDTKTLLDLAVKGGSLGAYA